MESWPDLLLSSSQHRSDSPSVLTLRRCHVRRQYSIMSPRVPALSSKPRGALTSTIECFRKSLHGKSAVNIFTPVMGRSKSCRAPVVSHCNENSGRVPGRVFFLADSIHINRVNAYQNAQKGPWPLISSHNISFKNVTRTCANLWARVVARRDLYRVKLSTSWAARISSNF